jgi:hypothetical protein
MRAGPARSHDVSIGDFRKFFQRLPYDSRFAGERPVVETFFMKKLIPLFAFALLGFSLPRADAYDGLDLYNCRISAKDRVNSEGNQLTTLRDILAQDRANFHRFGRRDRVDEFDTVFVTIASRNLFQFARIRIDPALKRRILAGENVNLSVFVLRRDLIDIQEGLIDHSVG